MSHILPLTIPLIVAGALFASSDITPGINRFAIATYRDLARSGANLVLSPFNISTALSMLLEGARGQTAAAIAAAIAQARTGAEYQAAVASLAKTLTESANTGPNQLAIANGLWVQQGFPIEAKFEQTIRTLYAAPLTPLDFRNDTESARARINAWTADHTKGKIVDLFGRGSLNTATRLVLTSAIYFYGKWQSPFKPEATRTEPFRLGNGVSIEAKFMRQKSTFRYAELPSAQLLEMNYEGTPLVFDILLPKSDEGLAELERSLDSETLAQWCGSLGSEMVDVAVPKFRAESSFSLKETLSRMGMAEAFGAAADFSGIDGRRDLFVSDVVHKAFVDVSEEGTEAAAATGTIVGALAMRRDRTIFRADHPFLFFIRDTRSGAILFEGRLQRPEQQAS
ncbi:MAG TPA: serpin family protein [Bryobacteraceae bacterium]|nr:serpin family protein [Bryobacteraceae bacterium]